MSNMVSRRTTWEHASHVFLVSSEFDFVHHLFTSPETIIVVQIPRSIYLTQMAVSVALEKKPTKRDSSRGRHCFFILFAVPISEQVVCCAHVGTTCFPRWVPTQHTRRPPTAPTWLTVREKARLEDRGLPVVLHDVPRSWGSHGPSNTHRSCAALLRLFCAPAVRHTCGP